MLREALHPPVVIAPGYTENRVVWGWQIIRAATTLGIDALATRSIEADPRDQLTTALYLEARAGRYPMSEQDSILRFIEETGIPENDPELAHLVTGDGSFVAATRKYRGLCDQGRDLIDSEVVDLKTALRLTEPTTRCLWSFRHSLAEKSVSSRRIIATLVDELVRRDHMEVDACESLVAKALDSDDPRGFLYGVRYPNLTELERRFESVRKRFVAGTGVELRHPPYFEGDAFEVVFSFRTAGELVDRARVAQRLEPACDELFDLL
jgi:hypothetical protein